MTMATLAVPTAQQRAKPLPRPALAGIALGLGLALSILLNLMLGAVPVPAAQVSAALIPGFDADPAAAMVVRDIRLPRLLAALAVGAALAVSGAALQALFRNPLADPGLLGVSTGAALGAALWLVAGAGLAAAVGPALAPFGLPLASFAGALAAIGLVIGLGSRAGPSATILMLLVGIGVNALGGAVIGLITYISTDAQLRALSVWLLGTLAQVEWVVLGPALAIVSLTAIGLLRTARLLDLLALGEDGARHLGVDVPRLRLLLAVQTAMAVGAAVSVAGIIGFVGLVVPHMLRLLVGPGHRSLLPLVAMGGALAVSIADLLARLVALPAEVPVGVVMACVGAPAFLWVLLGTWRRIG
jgi:iron complex transport system permease protein